MLNRITRQPNCFPQTIQALKESRRPIALYGAGEVATKVIEILAEHGLSAAAVLVDKKVSPTQSFRGIAVQEFGDIPDINAYSVLVCIGNYKVAKPRVIGEYGAKHVFLIDNIYSLPEITTCFVTEHAAAFSSLFNSLADDRSREILLAFLNARISGDPSGLFEFYDPQQYFPADIPGYPNLSNDEVFVDCGAFTGDTLLDFFKLTGGKYQHVFAFEPDEKNFQALLTTIEKQQMSRVTPLRQGVFSSKKTFRFVSREISSQISDQGTMTIDVDTIDDVIGDAPVSLIKMDIEGAEYEALKGATNTIRDHRPRLAISAYHKPDDLIVIPQFLQSLVPDYKFYLRAHKCMSIDFVLYAI